LISLGATSPNLFFHLYQVCSLIPSFRHTSATEAP